MVQRTERTISLVPCSLSIVFEMEGDKGAFPLDEITDRVEDDIEVSTQFEIQPPSIQGDFEFVTRTRTNIIIDDWVKDLERALSIEASTNFVNLGWRIESN